MSEQQPSYSPLQMYYHYIQQGMELKEEILNNRSRIRSQMIKLNIAKKADETPSPRKLSSPKLSFQADNCQFFDQVLNQKCQTQTSFQDLFQNKEKIGEGAQSVVRRVVERKTGEQYAVKIIGHADAQKIVGIKSQYRLLRTLNIPTVIRAHYLFISEHESTCRLVLQFFDWPTLQAQINQCRFNEEMTSQIAKTLLQTVDYLHSRGVCHRDIKPQNILYNLNEESLKLIDFQVSALKKPTDTEMWTVTGSLFYKAPQMFSGSYTNKVDVWAVGIVVYELLHGHPPFAKEFINDTIQQICHAPIEQYLREDLDMFTKDFLQKCLTKDPKARLTANQALKEPFILQAANKSVTPKQENKLNNSFDATPNFEKHTVSWGDWDCERDSAFIVKKNSYSPIINSKLHLGVDDGIRLQSKSSHSSRA